MIKTIRSSIPLAVLLLLTACATFYTPRQPLPIAQVIEASKGNAPPQSVIQRIRESGTTYALRGSDFYKLKALGVADPVLDFLQQSLVDDIDLLTRYSVTGMSLGGCSFCYPQPVDVDRQASGFGVVASTPPGRYVSGKPPGVPDWVPPYVRGTTGRISTEQIAELIRNKTPEAEILEKIHGSLLTRVIGVGGWTNIRTRPMAGLGGAELASLHDQGATDAVLDALQSKFMAQFIEAERLRYQNLGNGPGANL
jgi:hypothetical protein